MKTADSIVTGMNILQIIECFSPSSVKFEIRFCLFRTWSFTLFTNDLDYTDNSNSVSSFPMINCCGLLIFEEQHRVFPICHENVVGILVSLPKKLHRVSPVVRTSQYQFSTLEKTMHGSHPTLSSLLKRNFPCFVHAHIEPSFFWFTENKITQDDVHSVRTWRPMSQGKVRFEMDINDH